MALYTAKIRRPDALFPPFLLIWLRGYHAKKFSISIA
nr:MAG TPA_asm: hypothetical protein [Caudoviricetes sp.]